MSLSQLQVWGPEPSRLTPQDWEASEWLYQVQFQKPSQTENQNDRLPKVVGTNHIRNQISDSTSQDTHMANF